MARFPFVNVRASLADVAGDDVIQAVCAARAALAGGRPDRWLAAARRRLAWYPPAFHRRLLALLPSVGRPVCPALPASARGATTRAFAAATARGAAPLATLGLYRVGEDGRLYLASKSEHYHAPLGHGFPGYRLIETARRLGIPNATHNNTRGHLTRLLEERLIAAARGLAETDAAGLARALAEPGPGLPNRVLNLETGSLAVEAGVKLMLARFYRMMPEDPPPPYAGRTPVLLVMADDSGGLMANYHGTTMPTQILRGLWPEAAAGLAAGGLLRVHAIRANAEAELEEAFARYERPPFKVAGFLHEIVMMNYGARLLTPAFLQRAYALCARHDVPTLADEIQSCLWAPGLFLYREYGLSPNLVAVGKGFPGGEYPASRLLLSAALDRLSQFGALVTNGQEELASLAYLVTMRWAQANEAVVRRLGDAFEERVRALAARFPARLAGVSGRRHLLGLAFHTLKDARAFAARLNADGLDISAQTYKTDCPPVALVKLPLTACETILAWVVARMQAACEAKS